MKDWTHSTFFSIQMYTVSCWIFTPFQLCNEYCGTNAYTLRDLVPIGSRSSVYIGKEVSNTAQERIERDELDRTWTEVGNFASFQQSSTIYPGASYLHRPNFWQGINMSIFEATSSMQEGKHLATFCSVLSRFAARIPCESHFPSDEMVIH